jgi:hypothetical protein
MATLFSKLQYKGAPRILLLNAPEEFQPLLAELDSAVQIDRAPNRETAYDFALVFVASSAQIDEMAGPAAESMSDDGVLWFAYPKKSSKKYDADISRDSGWQPLGNLGYEPVRQVAIDTDWSALRFRPVGNIKKITRSFAMSAEGKRRTGKGERREG